jgi:hypothetical protein
MEKKKIGFNRLVEVIGKEFFEAHKADAVFGYGDEDMGLYCFLGIDLHPELRTLCLSCDIDEWDVYATCFVTDNDVIMDKCKLPQLNM